MAERRMFSKSVIGSARFLRMPQTSRLLYYDLGMAADDDGVVEAFTVIRTTGAAEDDLRVLATRGFITVLNDDLVSYITDWSVNNQLRKDRYHPSIYASLLVRLGDGNQAATNGKPDGNQMEPESSLGKSSLVEESVEADKPPTRPRFSPPTVDEVRDYCDKRRNGIDPVLFVDFYETRGWTAGRGKMRDWKAAVRTWERRNEKGTEETPKPVKRGRLVVDESGEEVADFG